MGIPHSPFHTRYLQSRRLSCHNSKRQDGCGTLGGTDSRVAGMEALPWQLLEMSPRYGLFLQSEVPACDEPCNWLVR